MEKTTETKKIGIIKFNDLEIEYNEDALSNFNIAKYKMFQGVETFCSVILPLLICIKVYGLIAKYNQVSNQTIELVPLILSMVLFLVLFIIILISFMKLNMKIFKDRHFLSLIDYLLSIDNIDADWYKKDVLLNITKNKDCHKTSLNSLLNNNMIEYNIIDKSEKNKPIHIFINLLNEDNVTVIIENKTEED